MEVRVKVLMTFLSKPVPNKVATGEKIIAGLAANAASFPEPPVSIINLKDVNSRLQQAEVTASTGGKAAFLNMKAIETEWIAGFKATANYVNYIANGNAKLIAEAGFSPSKNERKRKQRASIVSNLKATPGKGKGTCIASCKGEKGVNGYVSLAAPDAVTATMNGDTLEINVNGVLVYVKPSGKRVAKFEALPSSKPLCVTMFAFNSAGSGPLAPVVEVTPQ